jgi:hypothetical protein
MRQNEGISSEMLLEAIDQELFVALWRWQPPHSLEWLSRMHLNIQRRIDYHERCLRQARVFRRKPRHYYVEPCIRLVNRKRAAIARRKMEQ